VVIATHPHSSNLVPLMHNLGFNVPRKWEAIRRTHEQKKNLVYVGRTYKFKKV
jgi:hypothetical protein